MRRSLGTGKNPNCLPTIFGEFSPKKITPASTPNIFENDDDSDDNDDNNYDDDYDDDDYNDDA